jgi:energy-coupling factor transporter transmembrane protein EcfT
MFTDMSSIEILKLLAPLLIAYFALVIFCLIKLRRDKVRHFPKWAWALIIIGISTFGPLLYLFLGRERD